MSPQQPAGPVDTPIAVYRLTRQFLAIVVAGVLIKWLLFSVVSVRTSHMRPSLLDGDRVIVRRGMGAPGLLFGAAPRRGAVVLCDLPGAGDIRTFLRVAAVPGDTLRIDSASVTVSGQPPLKRVALDSMVLPAEYAPRDFFAPWAVPRRGTVLDLDSLSQRDLLFAASIHARQYPRRTVDVDQVLFVDGIPSNEYIIANFLLYEGAFDSIPDSLDLNWFFWDRLRENLRFSLKDREVRLDFALLDNGVRLTQVTVKRSFVFVLADNWEEGFDSRYFGPLSTAAIHGVASRLLWAARPGSGAKRRGGRILAPVSMSEEAVYQAAPQ